MGVAGLSFGIASQLGISPQSTDFSNRLANSAVQTGVASAVNAAKGGDIGQNLLQAGINTAVSVASCAVAGEIKTWYSDGDIGSVLHKVCHAGSGFLQGMASNLDDPIRGGMGGAFAGLAELVFEALPPGSLSPGARANIAIMSAATAAFFTKQDVNAAALTATNAVYHNSLGDDKDDKGKEEAGVVNDKGKEEVIERTQSPRISEAYIEQGLQFGRTNIVNPLYEHVIDPLRETDAAHALRMGLNAEYNDTLEPRFNGEKILPPAREALREGLHQIGKLGEIVTTGIRRDCRVLGISPAVCQDIGDTVNAGILFLSMRGVGGTRAVQPGVPLNMTKTVANMNSAAGDLAGSRYVNAGITWGKGIGAQGYPWETHLANQFGIGTRLPINFKTFDFFDRRTGTAISAKTLNTQTAAKLANPEKVYHSIKRNIDAAAGFVEHKLNEFKLTSEMIQSREIRLAVPKQTTQHQWDHLKRAIDYGKERNIKLIITETK